MTAATGGATRPQPSALRRAAILLGPALVAAVAYVDPGNFATNIQGGARFGYRLVWVVVAANLIAMLVQTLSAKLGLVTGRSLPEHIRDRAPAPVTVAAWIGAEIVAMATDLAEVLGAGLGLQLLCGVSLFPATLIAGVATFGVLALQRRGMPFFEALIGVLIGIIALCYLAETVMGKPDFAAAGRSFLPPRLGGTQSVLLAVGILGATVMPHVIYLHSAMTDDLWDGHGRLRRMLRVQRMDVVLALGLAGLVNVLMLMLAAVAFHDHNARTIGSIPEAYRTLTPILGRASSAIFGISLLASGLSASAVGTYAGQIVMQGFIHRSIPIWVRRLVTLTPALIVAAMGVDATRALVVSQVVLSFGIPPALIPLAWLTGREQVMGALRNGKAVNATAWLLVALVSALNVFLIVQAIG